MDSRPSASPAMPGEAGLLAGWLQPSSNWQAVGLYAGLVPLFTLLSWWALSYVQSPLKRYPGPVLAGWTNLWRFFLVRTGQYPRRIKELHDKYGPVVRIGPNLLDLDCPELIKTIYGKDEAWRKTEFYQNNSIMVGRKIVYNVFSMIDPAEHARMQKPVAKYFSISGILALEPLMDESVQDLCNQLEQRFAGGTKTCDLGEWIAYCTWDLITSITFSRPYGYMSKGSDFDSTITNLDKTIDYFSAIGQMPFLDFLLDKNPIKRMGPPNLDSVAMVAGGALGARMQGKDERFDPAVPDLLQHFIDAKAAYPDVVDDFAIMGYMMIPLLAGADTTAITIRAVFYYLLRNPATYRKLQDEVLAAGLDPDKPAPYSAARSLPYLEAVIRESMRLHPAVCMPLERYVPASGLTLPDGSFLPPGTSVGINPFILGRNEKLWGDDVDEFRPDRWLPRADESETAYQDRLRPMKAAELAFGAGARMCTGRHLALVEVYKITATLVGRFDIELVDPAREWTVVGIWFARQTGILCHLKRRGGR